MAKHSEKDFIIPTLKVIYFSNNGCTTDFIKSEVNKHIDLSSEDKEPLPSRNKNEPGYYQIVGNLISHKNPQLLKYIDLVKNNEEKKSSKFIWKLNSEGRQYIEQLINSENNIYPNLESDSKNYNECDSFDEKIIEQAKKNNLKTRPDTNQVLANTIAEINNHQCQYGILINKKHNSFLDKRGNRYVEVHHLIPMKASSDFFPKGLDRPSNLVCLCPLCHSRLHRGSINEKKEMLKILYDAYIRELNNDDIYITFDELLNKYYS